MTRVVVAHRRETIALADRVVRIEAGRVVANVPQRANRNRPPRAASSAPAEAELPRFTLRAPSGDDGALFDDLD
jgi:hypothetical protein